MSSCFAFDNLQPAKIEAPKGGFKRLLVLFGTRTIFWPHMQVSPTRPISPHVLFIDINAEYFVFYTTSLHQARHYGSFTVVEFVLPCTNELTQ